LSEGPIEGLVDGTNSIFLDKTPVTIEDKKYQPIVVAKGNFTASTLTIVDSTSSNPFANLSTEDGKRFVRIAKGKKLITGNGTSTGISGTEGSNIITSSTAFFSADDLASINPATGTDVFIDTEIPDPFIRIEGAGANSSVELVTPIVRFISTTSVEIGQPLPRDITHKTAAIDKIGTIASFTNANTAVITQSTPLGTAKVDATNVEILVNTPAAVNIEDPIYNFQNFSYSFMNGHPDQPYLKGFKDIGSASIIENKNVAIEQTAGLLSSNNNTITGKWTDNTAAATAQAVVVTDNAISNPNEVDSIKLTFKSPTMIAAKSSSGDEKPANCELRIFLGYKKTGDNAFTQKLMFGPTDEDLSSRQTNKQSRPWENAHNSGRIRTETRTPFAESFTIDLTPYKPLSDYQITIQRVDPAIGKNGDYNHTATVTLDTVEHRFTDKLSYPHAAYSAVLFDAESFSKIPSRSYELKGLKVKVPTNYFPKGEGGRTHGEYDRNISSGVDSGSYQNWDGNFRGDLSTYAEGHVNHELVWTDNPAWIFYDLVTNKRYGIGKYIENSQVDKFELYKIARYCDELVADGKGGLEPRFTANVYIKEAADALKVLKDISQVFRGMLYWLDGQIQFSQNRYEQPIFTFSKANTIGGFAYTSPRGQFRSNQIRVTWNDPDSMYKQAVEIVEDTNNILETGKVVPKTIVAFGATSRGQAHRFGKWSLFTEILEAEAVAFQSSINAGFLKPGNVVLIQDADKDVISNSGRLSSSSSVTGINLDRPINLSSGNTFKLSIMYPQGGAYLSNTSAIINDSTTNASVTNTYQRGDLITHAKVGGTVVELTTDEQTNNAVDSSGDALDLVWNPNSRIETQTISSTGSSVSSVTVSSAFTSAPESDSMWAIREYDAAGVLVNGSAQQYVIVDIKEEPNKLYTISAAKYEPSKFDMVDRGYILDVGVDTNKLPTFRESPPAPETLSLEVVKSFNAGLNDSSNILGATNQIRINWGRVLNDDGTEYKHLSHFEIKHNIDSSRVDKFKKLTVAKTENVLSVDFDGPKEMIVQVQSVNINGGKSSIVQRKIEVTNSQVSNGTTEIFKVPSDGKIDKHIQCGGSNVSIDSVNYQLQSSDGTIYTNPSNGNTASYQQSFVGMAANSEAYLLFDASESATSGDVLKAVENKIDSTALLPLGVNSSNAAVTTPLAFEYLAEVGAANNGITTETGTISGAVGDNIITGSSTDFTTEFENGDIIVIAPAGTTRFYSKINYIESNTKLQIATPLPRTYSGVSVSSLSFKSDPISDVILAKVSYDGSTYTVEEKYSEGTESLGYFHHENTSNTNALSANAFKTEFGRFPQEGDILIVVNTAPTPKVSKSYKFASNAFSEIANFMTGDLVVDGSISGTKINSATKVTAGTGNNVGVLDGADSTFRIYAGHATPASAPFRVTQGGALTATSATIGGAIDATTLNVVNASVVGSLTASELTAGSVTVQSLNQAVWNEIDSRVAGPAANGFYDNKNSTTGYLGVSKTLSLTGSSSAGYQHNGEDLHLRFNMVDSFGPTPAGFTGNGLKVTAQFQYRLASSSTWINVGSSLTESLTKTDYSSGSLYDIDMDHDAEISSSLTTTSYYHFQVVLTPTITDNAFVAFINYGQGGANDTSGSPFLFAAQQGSTSVGSGSGTVTSVGSGDGLTGGAITGSGTLAVDSTVVRTTGTQTIAGDKTFSNDIIVSGNLDVQGTTTTIDTTNLDVKDKNITLNYSTGDSSASANGAGITIQDAVSSTQDATLTWNTANDSFNFSHNLNFADNIKAQFGAGNDLQIYHDGNNSRVEDTGTGGLRLIGGNFVSLQSTSGENMVVATENGAVTLYHNNNAKLATTSSGIDVTGTVTADTHFTSSDSNATLSSSGSGGYVYLRPNGNGTATGETRIDTNGLLKVNSIDTSHGLEIAQSTNTGYAPASILLRATQSTARGGGIYSYNTQTDNGWYSGTLYNNTDKWAVTFANGTSFNSAIAQTTYAKFTVHSNGNVDIAGTANVNTISSTGDLTLDAVANINLDADGGAIRFKDGGTSFGEVFKSSSNMILYSTISNGDMKFMGVDGGNNITALTLDMSNAGKALFNAGANFGSGIDVTGTTVTDGLTVNSGDTSSFLSIRNGSNSSFTKLYSDLNGVTILDVDANNVGAAPRFQIDVSEVQALRITEGGDISFYDDTGSTQGFFWDASAEKLGIGTTSPLDLLHIKSSTTDARQVIDGHTGYDAELKFAENGTVKYTIGHDAASDNFVIGTTNVDTQQRLVIDSAGNVGIGDTAPQDYLEINGSGRGLGGLTISNSSASHAALSFARSSTATARIYANEPAALHTSGLRFQTSDASGGAPNLVTAMFIDEYQKIGIGTTSPSANLEITQSGNNVGLLVAGGGYNYTAKFESVDAEANIIIEDSNSTNDGNMIGVVTNDMYFITDTTERMRIDSSGNLLVGTTDTSLWNNGAGGNTGTVIESDGTIQLAKSNNATAYFNRLDSDGDIVSFRKNGSSVGSIGTVSNGKLIMGVGGSSGTNLIFADAFDEIYPSQNGVTTLGDPGARFKDLHLSGTINSTKYDIHNEGGGSLYQTDGYIRFANGNTETVRIDSSGNVGIGVTPSSPLHVNVGTNQNLEVDSDGSELRLSAVNDARSTNPAIRFQAESYKFYGASGVGPRATIDSSGNLLVATTDTTLLNNTSGGGFSVSSNGFTQIAKQGVDNADPVLILNQTGLDGEILRFYKDGGIVGSIGSNSDALYISSPYGNDSGLRFVSGIIAPATTTGANRDAAIDLGYSSGRFKDLYLSGTANVSSVTSSGNIFMSTNGSILRNSGGALQLQSDASQVILRSNNTTALTLDTSQNATFAGTISAAGDIIAYASSDARLKDNVTVIDSALNKVKQIRGVEFDWNDKQDTYKGHDIGVIAQDVEQVAPELVKDREDGYKAVDYPKLTALLIEAVKELELKVKELEEKLQQ